MTTILQKSLGRGNPFNIAACALLTVMVAQVIKSMPGDFVHTLGYAHLYSKDIFSFNDEDFELPGYEADQNIKTPVAV